MILVIFGYSLSFKIMMNNSKEEGSSVTDLWIQFNLVYSYSPMIMVSGSWFFKLMKYFTATIHDKHIFKRHLSEVSSFLVSIL